MGRKKSTNTETEGSGKPKATWPDEVVAIFCDIAVKEVAKGNMPGTHFDKKGWANIVLAFKELTGRDYDKKQLKNKWDSLKNDWKLWSSLLHKETGIGWDPAKGERYHLPHFCKGDELTGHKEIFNHAHSSLRGVIERTFGVWKKKWSILRDMPHFPYEKQVKIAIATMTLHNYIRRYAQRDIDFDESGNYSSEETSEEMENNEHDGDCPGRQEMEVLRNAIAQSLMNAST